MNRLEKRRRLDREAVARGLDLAKRDVGQLAALMRVLAEELRQAAQAGSLAPFMEFLYGHYARTEAALARVPIACRKGCAYCCHIWVGATAPEILHVAQTLAAPERAALRDAVFAANRKTQGLPSLARSQAVEPCPMLRDNRCAIYARRPLVCRAAVSRDAQACERAIFGRSRETIPTPRPYVVLSDGYLLALAGALKACGFGYRAYEYNHALKVALQTPDAEKAWLSGKDVFAGVQRDNDLFATPDTQMIYALAFG